VKYPEYGELTTYFVYERVKAMALIKGNYGKIF